MCRNHDICTILTYAFYSKKAPTVGRSIRNNLLLHYRALMWRQLDEWEA
jgi:hypothetical protein